MTDLQIIGPVRAVLLAVLAVLAIPACASVVAEWGRDAYTGIDPDGAFAWRTVHHVAMLGFTLLAMRVLFRVPLSTWGFNLDNLGTSLKIIAVFAVGFGLLEFAYLSGGEYSPGFPDTARNRLGWQAFQYGLSGLAEEPLCRGLVVVLLLHGMHRTGLRPLHQQAVAVVLSTALFMAAHLGIDWSTLSVTHVDVSQQTKALQLGLLYAVVFIHTRSLLAPIVMHGLSNGLTASIGFYLI